MNKKILSIIAGAALIVAAGITVFSLMRSHKDTALISVPKDATAIARIDVMTFLHDADFSSKEGKQLIQQIMQTENITELGLDLNSPVYGFITESGDLGMSAAVDDVDALIENCHHLMQQGRATEIEKQRGYHWSVIEQKWLMCFDNDKALLMGPSVGSAQDGLRAKMVGLMQQSQKESAFNSLLYTYLKEKHEPIATMAEADVLPNDFRELLMKQLKVKSLDGIQLALGLGSDKDDVRIDADLIAEQVELKQRLEELNSIFRPIKGDLINRADESSLLWTTCNVKGEQLLELLRKSPDLRTVLIGLNTIVDFDLMLKAIDGDLTAECTSLSFILGFRRQLPVRLLARLDNEDFLTQSDYWIKSAAANPAYELMAASPHDFVAVFDDKQAWFGVKDKTLYLTGSSSLANAEKSATPNAYLMADRSHIKGLRFYASLDIQPLTVLISTFAGSSPLDRLLLFQRINLEMGEVGHFTLKLVAPEGSNVVKKIILGK